MLSISCCGCATLFHTNPPKLVIEGPPGIRAFNASGEEVNVHNADSVLTIFPRRGTDDSLIIEYNGMKQGIHLTKKLWGWSLLNSFNVGGGFLLDEATDSWYDYNMIRVTNDTSGGIRVTNPSWYGEIATYKRPQLLVISAVGFEFLPSMSGWFNLDFRQEFGIGFDLYQRAELFFHSEGASDIAVPTLGTTIYYASNGGVARYFVLPRYFVQGSYDVAKAYVIHFSPDVRIVSQPFRVVGAALGWAGDISFASIRYYRAIEKISFSGYPAAGYQGVVFTFGLNLRL